MSYSAHDRIGRGQAQGVITGDNITIAGGTFVTSFGNSPPNHDHNYQHEVLQTLYPPIGPPKIDAGLLHNAGTHGHARVEHYIDGGDTLGFPSKAHIRRELYHHFRPNCSRPMALSLARRLKRQGDLLATIILPPSSNTCANFIIPTLAYQLAQKIPASGEHILAAIQNEPCIYELNAETQFRVLFETPLRMASKQASVEERAHWPSVIVVDGNAHQFSPGSVPYEVVQLLETLSSTAELGIGLSLVVTLSTTIVDRATEARITLRQYIVASGNTACYFNWRIYG